MEPLPRRTNRRRSLRHKAKPTTKILCYTGPHGLGKNIAVSMLDLSETGLCLLVDTCLAARDEIEVRLVGVGRRQPQKNIAEVVWCVEIRDGLYCIGARFQRPLSYRDLQEMGTTQK